MAYELSNDIVAIILSMDAVLKDLISTQVSVTTGHESAPTTYKLS